MNCPMSNIIAKCMSCGNLMSIFCVQLILAVITIALGTLVASSPKKVIDIQIALYRSCNWKLEPISMEKELKNTRMMGLAAAILGIIALLYLLLCS